MFRKIIGWFEPPYFEDDERARLGRLLHYLLLIIISTLTVLYIIMGFTGALNPNIIQTLSALLVLLFTGWLLLKRGYLTAVSIGVVVSGFLGIVRLLGGEAGEGVRDPVVFGFLIVILIASLLLGWQVSAILTLATGIVLWRYTQLEITGQFVPTYVSADEYAMVVTSLIIIVAALLFLLDTGLRNSAKIARASERSLMQSNKELRELQGELEQRVQERTQELEISDQLNQRRAAQFEAIAQVSRAISTIQSPEELLPRIATMISQYFGFYHSGIFLLNNSREFAVLRAASSEGGRIMLERNHRLEVGKTGIVGHVTATGNPRIALDTGADAVYFDNPDLPETRSEMALPLKAGDQVFGALDVQSTEPNAFSQEDINILSTLSDQVSTAIQNARLYEESRETLAQADAAYRQLASQSWQDLQLKTPITGYRYDGTKPEPLIQPTDGDQVEEKKETFSVPVLLRGQRIGTLHINPPTEGHNWTEDEIAIIRATAERVALAAENARLVLESQKLASKEQVIGEISARIGSAINLDSIMQTTLREMGRILPGAEISIQVDND